MKFERKLIALAVVASLAPANAAFADEIDRVLAPVTTTVDREVEIQARTELGKLTVHTPISGAVVTQEQVEHLQLVNNLLELGKRVPGISMIRNMRVPDGGKLYTENRIDGMRATSTNTSLLDEVDMADIERIEVVTGPASALYGSGAFGGTINVFTRQPPAERRGKLSQELGSWGFKRTQGNAGNTFLNGRLGVIVTGSSMDNDGWRKSSAPGATDASAEHKDGLTLRSLVRVTDSTKLTLGLSQLKYDFRWAGPLTMGKFDQNWQQVEAGTYGQYIDEYKTTSFKLQQLVGEKGEFSLAHTRIGDDGINNGNGGSGGANNVICDDGGPLAAPIPVGRTVKCRAVNNNSAAVNNTVKAAETVTKTTQAMYRHEFNLAKATAYLGAEEVKITSDSTTYNNIYNALQAQAGLWEKGAMTATGQGSFTQQKETTPFVHFEFTPAEKWRVHLGERFGSIDYNVDDRTANNRDVTMKRKGNVLRSGVTYDITKNHLVWGNWGETFNPQSTGSMLNSLPIGTLNNVIGRPLDPERGVTREIGFRGLFPEAGLRYDVTLYDANSDGFLITRTCSAQEQTDFNGGLACTINDAAGELETKGIESMFSWAVKPWLDIGATYTNATANFVDFKTTAFDFSGKSYQAMPRHKFNLRLGVKPAPGWLVELEGDHISDYYVDNTNLAGTYSRPDLFSLRTSYRAKNWSAWAHIINLTNRQYATRVQLSTVAGVANTLAAQAGQGNAGSYAPLTLRVGLAYNF